MLIELLVSVPIILLAWMYVGYPFALKLISKLRRNRIIKGPIEPKVSVVICTYNESLVIDRRIENILKQDYPKEKIEIIIVDSSTDSTAAIIKKKWLSDVMLIEQKKRQGKPSATNLALKKVSGEIIIMSDAPTLFKKDAIRKIVRNFADPRVGGVTGRYDPVGEPEGVKYEERLFWRFKNMIKSLEASVDSTTFFSGDLCAFRKGLIKKVDEDSIADDVNIAMKIRKKGYKAIYDPCAKVVEMAPNNYKDLLTQKVRRAIGGIRETIRFKDAIFNPNFGFFGMLILPMRLMYIMLSPFISLSCLLTFAYVFVRAHVFHHLLNLYVFFLLLFICSLVGIFRRSFPIKALTLFLVTQFFLLQALLRYPLKKFSVRWEQTESTRRNERCLKHY